MPSMQVSRDVIGALLREFYAVYGRPEEGPPPGLNVSAVMGVSSVEKSELHVLRGALADQALRRQFVTCNSILEDLATRLTGEELLQELCGIPLPAHAFEDLSCGVFWFALASSLDGRDGAIPATPFDKNVDLPLPVKLKIAVEGSLVLRLYVALVYMREGVLSQLVAQSARAGGRCSGMVRKLLSSDYVRRIRNAPSHGSFSSCIAGIAFRDDGGVVVATPGFLNWLSTWLTLIQLQALAASSRGPYVA